VSGPDRHAQPASTNPARRTSPVQGDEASGGSVIDSKVVDALVEARTRSEDSPLAELTPREHQILSEIASGKSNAAIAESLVLTKRAVEKHINSIFLKLGLTQTEDTSKRVKATLLFLAEREGSAPSP
jgi:DNA-binding NarL/FixJ family response regulator